MLAMILNQSNISLNTILLLMFFLINSSCHEKIDNHKSITYQKITDSFKIDFLKEILADTIILDKKNKSTIIFEKKLENNMIPVKLKNKNEFYSNVKLTSLALNEEDTLFIHNQLNFGKFDTEKLKLHGFSGMNWNNIIRNEYIEDSLISSVNLVSEDSLNNIYNILEKHSSIAISNPIFNKELNKSHIEVDFGSYRGYGYLFEKLNNKWVLKSLTSHWIR